MTEKLKIGLTFSDTFVVQKDQTIGFMGEDRRVYSTPSMVQNTERSCRNFLLKYIDSSQDSVGTIVGIEHLGPTLIGQKVTINSQITDIDRRRIEFLCQIYDELDHVGRMKHTRFIIDKIRQSERLELKIQRMQEAGINRNS